MKYYQTSKFPSKIIKSGATLIAVFCLVLIGAAAWFASSKIDTQPQENSPKSQNSSTYSDQNSSYNMSEDNNALPSSDVQSTDSQITESAEEANKTVSDQPYEESEDTASQEESPAVSFMLPISGNIAKGYSDTALQYSATYDDLRLHTGIDILCDEGSEVLSAASGTVISVEQDPNLGQVIAIDHSNGITARYCSLASVNVRAGDTVRAGDSLGTSGTVPSESSDLPHIHIEVLKDGNIASPLQVFGLE